MLVTAKLAQLTGVQADCSSGFTGANRFLLGPSGGGWGSGVVLHDRAGHLDRALGPGHPSPQWVTLH